MRSGLSARHLSFLETGRSQPSRQALAAIAEALDVPLRERNRLFEAAGYAPAYRQTPLASDEMAHIRRLLTFILQRHEPYGAVVLDRYWNMVMSNAAAGHGLRTFSDPSLWDGDRANLLKLMLHPLGIRRCIANWDDVSRHFVLRAHRELGNAKDDPAAVQLLNDIHGYPGVPERPFGVARALASDLLLPIHLEKDGVGIRLFTTIMTLGTPQDVTLQELRIETFFPADEESDAILSRAMVRVQKSPI